MTVKDIVFSSALFYGFNREMFNSIFPRLNGNVCAVSEGEAVLAEGQYTNSIGIILEGKFNAIKTYSTGTTSIIDMLWSPGLWGVDIVFTRTRKSSLSLVSLTSARVFVFPCDGLDSLKWMNFECRERIIANIIAYIADESMRKQNKIEIISQSKLRDRITTFLNQMYHHRDSAHFSIPFTREQLADYLCVNRSALSHELSLMQQEGLIQFRKSEFHLSPTICGQ